MNDKLKNFLSNLTDADYEKMASDLAEKIKENNSRLEVFSKTPRFKEILTLMQEHLETHEQATDDAYSAFVFSSVTNDEFITVFECLFNTALFNLEQSEEADCPFATEVVHYEGMRFVMMHGQGTAYILKRDNK